MIESFFLTVNQWMTADGHTLALLGCFLWGMVSVLFSPCHLASIPLMVAYIGGQREQPRPMQAMQYSIIFTTGLFISIAAIGIICAILGRMLGDVGNYWQILVGLVLVWVSLGMFGVKGCSMGGGFLHRMKFRDSGARWAWVWLTVRFPAPAPSDLLRRFWQSLRFSNRLPAEF